MAVGIGGIGHVAVVLFFFFNDTATTEIYTLSLHDALPIFRQALGTQQTPPNQILIGMSLFLTFFIMEPVWSEIGRAHV